MNLKGYSNIQVFEVFETNEILPPEYFWRINLIFVKS